MNLDYVDVQCTFGDELWQLCVVAVHNVAARNSDTAMSVVTDKLNRDCPYYYTKKLTFKYFTESMPLGRKLQKHNLCECHAHHWHLVYPFVFLPQTVRAAVCTVLLSLYMNRLYALSSHSATVCMLAIRPNSGERAHESRPCTACILIGFPCEVWTESVLHAIFPYPSMKKTLYYAWFVAHFCTAVPRGRAESKLAPLATCDRDYS
jgi:hypothetical protein